MCIIVMFNPLEIIDLIWNVIIKEHSITSIDNTLSYTFVIVSHNYMLNSQTVLKQ